MLGQLYDLAHSGDVDGVRSWLAKRPDDLNDFIGEGYTPLHIACLFFGHEALVKALLAAGALVNINAMNESGATPLHCAVVYRDELAAERVVHTLLDHGAELNAIQKGGQTALHHAVARGSLILTRALIHAGADPFFEDEQKRSPADLARELNLEKNTDEIRAVLKEAFSLQLET